MFSDNPNDMLLPIIKPLPIGTPVIGFLLEPSKQIQPNEIGLVQGANKTLLWQQDQFTIMVSGSDGLGNDELKKIANSLPPIKKLK